MSWMMGGAFLKPGALQEGEDQGRERRARVSPTLRGSLKMLLVSWALIPQPRPNLHTCQLPSANGTACHLLHISHQSSSKACLTLETLLVLS